MPAKIPEWVRITVEPTEKMKELSAEAQKLMDEYHRLESIEQRKAWGDLCDQIEMRGHDSLEGKRKRPIKHPQKH
ncbi:hypothetical protein [Marinobacterium jannaschii]|uniref:hypothetical protein n=1 Tax=Marinobacterium jannaschii TaxID=64970 RepID=UPI0004879F5F|nr:hypothetical protein [Marinobacterium jannaschii]